MRITMRQKHLLFHISVHGHQVLEAHHVATVAVACHSDCGVHSSTHGREGEGVLHVLLAVCSGLHRAGVGGGEAAASRQ